jgi:hypothetical protein
MISSIEQYLAELKKALAGSDRAVIQDALADADEYLRTSYGNYTEANPDVPETEAMASITEKYGSPAEVAAAYRDIEARTPPTFARPAPRDLETPRPAPAVAPAPPDTRPIYVKFFAVFIEPRAWASLFYLLFALATGIIYFTWAVTGLALSAGLMVLIIGLPFFFLFLLSIRGIALVEGRLVEALLGVRMPRRPLFTRRDVGLRRKLTGLLTQRQTWTAMVYMVLQLPLGVISFSIIVTLLATSLWLIGRPIIEMYLPAFTTTSHDYYTAGWAMPFAVIGGALQLLVTMHVAKYAGRLLGAFAKVMLVRE